MTDIKYQLFLVAFLCFVAPAISLAQGPPQVLISEVAWMGTDANPAHEWIEIYSLDTIDLAGWTLTSDDNNISIALSGELTPHSIHTLERDTDSTVSDVTALFTYTGEMEDSGGTLTLKNPEGSTVDLASWGTNLPDIGGINTTPIKTPQRTRMGTWVTASPTPGLDNAQENDPLPDESIVVIKNTGGGGSSRRIFEVNIVAPTTAYVGKPTTLSAIPLGVSVTKVKSVEYNWNFGDAEVSEETEPIHAYMFPGEYIVMLEASLGKKQLSIRHDIEILPHPVLLSLTETDDVAIKNISETELELDNYKLSAAQSEFIFPKNSFLKPDATITLPRSRFETINQLELHDLDDFVIAKLYQNENSSIPSTPTNLPKIITPAPLTGNHSPTILNKAESNTDNKKFGFETKNTPPSNPVTTNGDESGLATENSEASDEQTTNSNKSHFRNIINRIAYFFGIN
jgi:hypothetical protein